MMCVFSGEVRAFIVGKKRFGKTGHIRASRTEKQRENGGGTQSRNES